MDDIDEFLEELAIKSSYEIHFLNTVLIDQPEADIPAPITNPVVKNSD